MAMRATLLVLFALGAAVTVGTSLAPAPAEQPPRTVVLTTRSAPAPRAASITQFTSGFPRSGCKTFGRSDCMRLPCPAASTIAANGMRSAEAATRTPHVRRYSARERKPTASSATQALAPNNLDRTEPLRPRQAQGRITTHPLARGPDPA